MLVGPIPHYFISINFTDVELQLTLSNPGLYPDPKNHFKCMVHDLPQFKKYLYNYQGDKYFVPASNTKIPTCYAAMKYLGDSLVGLYYAYPQGRPDKLIMISPAGDPTLLHEDFRNQRVYQFLKDQIIDKRRQIVFVRDSTYPERWGNGWSWNDYQSSYMAERSVLPIFGNTITISLKYLVREDGKQLKTFSTASAIS